MKKRFGGRVHDGHYEITDPDGGVIRQIPLDEAKQDSKLAAAIKRNGWEGLPDG